MAHESLEPAPFLTEVLDSLPAPGGWVLDLACGQGRNALALGARGDRVIGLDRDAGALRELALAGRERAVGAVCSDVEAGYGIPFESATCDIILVFRFLFRPLSSEIERVLAPGGLLVYETFTVHQKNLGYGPRNPAFLLRPGELPGLFPGLLTEHHEEGQFDQPKPQAVARLLARKPA